ncbi:MAG TPA: hypothetical protein ENI51_05280, partial [Candidatus Atribacteria bacterium]|nr:hypothetical protein [Candidatus Atribacteria bacterium]
YTTGCGIYNNKRTIILKVNFYPIRYSPENHQLKFGKKIKLIIEYEKHETKQIYFSQNYNMLIIGPDYYYENMIPYIKWKKACNFSCFWVNVSDIYSGKIFANIGRDEPESIKMFIYNAIEQWNITYLLIVGGSSDVPVRYGNINDGEEEEYISDLYYADIYNAKGEFCSWDANQNNLFGEYGNDGVDLYPDIYFGRLACAHSSEVSRVLGKIISYTENNSPAQDWFSNIVVVGGDTFDDDDNLDEGELLNQRIEEIMFDYNPVEIWASNGLLNDTANINNAIEAGASFIDLSGHGSKTSWATHPHKEFDTWIPYGAYRVNDISRLKNKNKLIIAVVNGCSNSNFGIDHCFSWAFLSNPMGGGIASFGYSGISWGYLGRYHQDGLSGGMQIKMFEAFSIEKSKTLGELWVNGLSNYIKDYINRGSALKKDFKLVEEYQIFGDPSLSIVEINSQKPNTPSQIIGPDEGKRKKEYTFTSSTDDPDQHMIRYCFDWGDGKLTWSDWINSGETVSMNHSWEKIGHYDIKVKARDPYGLESNWSEPHMIKINFFKSENLIAKLEHLVAYFPYFREFYKNILGCDES